MRIGKGGCGFNSESLLIAVRFSSYSQQTPKRRLIDAAAAHPTGWANQAKSSGKGKYCQNFQNFQKIMNKSTVSAGTLAYQRSGKVTIDFLKTFNVCLDFVFKNNQMRKRQIQDLIDRGIDLKAKRDSFKKFKEYQRWLESEGVLPWLNGAVETTLEKLISFFRTEFQKGKVKLNNQLRFTYSYFQQYYNSLHRTEGNRVCQNTIKNHFQKIQRSLGSIFSEKYRGQLGLPDQNTNCIVLTIAPNIIQYRDDRHTKVLSSQEPRLKPSNRPQRERAVEQLNQQVINISEDVNTRGGLQSLDKIFENLTASFFSR